MFVKINRLIHWEMSKLGIFLKDRLLLTIGWGCFKLDNAHKLTTTRSCFLYRFTGSNGNRRVKGNNRHEGWSKSVSMISWRGDTWRWIAQSLMISSLELRLPVGRTLGLIFAPRIKDDAEWVARETDREFVLMILLLKIQLERQRLIEFPNEFLALDAQVMKTSDLLLIELIFYNWIHLTYTYYCIHSYDNSKYIFRCWFI